MRSLFVSLCLVAATAVAYPIDGYDYSSIRRLEFYRLALLGEVNGRRLPDGGQLGLDDVQLRLAGTPQASMDLPEDNDPALDRQLSDMLHPHRDRYAVAILDLSDPEAPAWIGHRLDHRENVGSVGKVLAGLALFQVLADVYPDDIAARERVLRETVVVADEFVHWDHHEVVFWGVEDRSFQFRQMRDGDTGTLWEYLDWMLSASSNAAAAMVMREIILLSHFREAYPVDDATREAFFAEYRYDARGEIFLAAMNGAVERNGLDPATLRQGSFFTREGKRRVAGTTSYATPRSLMELLLRMEQGRLVDEWSSRELKRLLYMTQKRIRYASHPALNGSAVYFKSGSLYSCQEEEGFTCGKYMGNRKNFLASVAIVESPAGTTDLHYLVVVHSNVLRVNSAVAHQTLAMRIHRMLEARNADRLRALAEARAAPREADIEAEPPGDTGDEPVALPPPE